MPRQRSAPLKIASPTAAGPAVKARAVSSNVDRQGSEREDKERPGRLANRYEIELLRCEQGNEDQCIFRPLADT